MVEKQIEFYFSKHPHTELDCGWSRKGSSNYERSLIMAKTSNTSRDPKFRSKRTAPAERIIYLAQPADCFDLRRIIEATSKTGAREIELRALYADYREPGFDPMATLECVRLCDFLHASYLITQYGYRLVMETTDGRLSLGRKAVTLKFVKEGNYDVYPKSSCSD